jgi:hypothetical protein
MVEGLPQSGHGSLDHGGRREQRALIKRKPMTLQAPNRDLQSSPHAAAQSIPAFKPVALPALAAAMRSAKQQSVKTKTHELPAILRKEALLDR